MSASIIYARDMNLSAAEYIDVVGQSALGANRPLSDPARIAEMIDGAGMIVTARLEGRCIGLARCLTDFVWVAYLADLAVIDSHQGRGIGKAILLKLKEELGDGVGIALLAIPEARPFYDHAGAAIGLKANANAYFMDRTRGA